MAKIPVFRISLTNATILSGAYLGIAALVELLRRVWNPRWIDRVSLSMEAFPARTLELFGLFEPLRQAWSDGKLTDFQVRLLYGGVTVTVIFTLGLLVGFMMWAVARVTGRAAQAPPEDE